MDNRIAAGICVLLAVFGQTLWHELQVPGRFTFLDTLAAAHAEAGQFDEAVRSQEKAIQLALAEQQDELRGRLEMYRQGKLLRETRNHPVANE